MRRRVRAIHGRSGRRRSSRPRRAGPPELDTCRTGGGAEEGENGSAHNLRGDGRPTLPRQSRRILRISPPRTGEEGPVAWFTVNRGGAGDERRDGFGRIDVDQALIAAVVREGQFLGVEAELVEDR